MMKKRIVSLLIAAMTVIGAVGLAGCSNEGNGASASDKKIGIIQMIENGAFNDMRDGIIAKLTANGYSKDAIDVQCAQGDASTLQTIAASMADGSYDAVFTIATPATQAMVNMESETPTFFCAVSAPVAAGVISDMDHPDKNATGTSNAIPVEDIFALCDKLTPDVTTVGFIYCTSEDNSVNTVSSAKAYCEEKSIPYEEVSVTNSSEVELAISTLCDKVDMIFMPNDATVQSAFEVVTQVTREKKIPVYASSATTVLSGAFATIAISDTGIGELTAEMGLKYLKEGTPVADIPAVVVPASATVVNEDTMNALGITLSDEVKAEITFLNDAE